MNEQLITHDMGAYMILNLQVRKVTYKKVKTQFHQAAKVIIINCDCVYDCVLIKDSEGGSEFSSGWQEVSLVKGSSDSAG